MQAVHLRGAALVRVHRPDDGLPSYLTAYFKPAPSQPLTLAQIESRYAGPVVVFSGNRATATSLVPSTLYVNVGGQTTTRVATGTYNELLIRRNGRWRIASISAIIG